ncbi:MAG TPA: hypothetical protein VFX59_30070, partial [Polyangiales bacterium]|nr:hypothetical protein [Polyangiales bacterium]
MGRTQRGSLLALGLAALTSVAACGESEPTGQQEDPSTSTDEDDDDVKPVKDAGKAKDAGKLVDAASPTVEDPKATGDAGAPPAGDPSSAWCKAKVVLDKYCTTCHDGEGTGPMPLLTLEDFRAAAPVTKGKSVYEVVGTRIHDTKNPMPPQKKLTADELAALDAIVASKGVGEESSCDDKGATGGDAGTAGGPDENGWDPTVCDAVYKVYSHGAALTDPYEVPVGQEIHPQIYWDAPWGNEKVQMINARPITDNRKVLHHWIVYSGQGAFLTGWAPGDDERTEFPPDIGMNMPTGARGLRL